MPDEIDSPGRAPLSGPYTALGQSVLDGHGERVLAVCGWNRRPPAERRAIAHAVAAALNRLEGFPQETDKETARA